MARKKKKRNSYSKKIEEQILQAGDPNGLVDVHFVTGKLKDVTRHFANQLNFREKKIKDLEWKLEACQRGFIPVGKIDTRNWPEPPPGRIITEGKLPGPPLDPPWRLGLFHRPGLLSKFLKYIGIGAK